MASVQDRASQGVHQDSLWDRVSKVVSDKAQCLSDRASSLYQAHPKATITVSVVGAVSAAWAIKKAVGRYSVAPSEWQKPFMAPNTVEVDTNKEEKLVVKRVADTSRERQAAARVFAQFMSATEDPMTRVCAAKNLTNSQFMNAVEWLYSTLLKNTVPTSTGCLTLQDTDRRAVAIWMPPGVELDEWSFLKSGGFAFLWRFSGWERRMRYLGFGEVINHRRHRWMRPYNQRYFYLLALGTTEPRIDNPASKAVMRAVLDKADKSNLPCILETSQEASKAFYETLGFETVEEFALFGTVVFLMIRAPQA